MKQSSMLTIALSSHDFEPGQVLTFADGRKWHVVEVHGATVSLRRVNWWRAMLLRMWPFQFRGFWCRVWTR